MLYAIGGVPRSGKTQLAARLHQELGVSVLATDAIVVSFMAVAPELGIDYGHPDRRKKIAPGVKAAVRQLLNNNEHYAMEGELLDPWLVDQLREVADVRSCFLTMSKPDFATIVEHEGRNAWVTELDESERLHLAQGLKNFNDEIVAQCIERELPFFDVSDGNYDTTLNKAYESLVPRALSLSA